PPRPTAPYRWAPPVLAPLHLLLAVLSIPVGRIAHHALFRTGRYRRRSRRWGVWIGLVAGVDLLIAAIGYGRASWILCTPELGCAGLSAIGALTFAVWTHLDHASMTDGRDAAEPLG